MPIETIIVLGPLLAAAFAGLLQKQIGDRVAMGVNHRLGSSCRSTVRGELRSIRLGAMRPSM